MLTPLRLAPVLLLHVALSGQFTTPPGYLSKEGMAWQNLTNTNGVSALFGYYQSYRYQLVDGELKPRGKQTLKSVGYRLDYRQHRGTALGRSWSNVRLSLSAGDHTKMSRTFSRNSLSTPTQVFSGTVAWPSVTGSPTSKPAPWSSSYAFPFGTGGSASQYVYDAKLDLCLDYTFAGGQLANRIPWSNPIGRLYLLDGVYTRPMVRVAPDFFYSIGSSRGSCADSNSWSTLPAVGWAQVNLWGPTADNPAWRGKAVADFTVSNVARSSFAVHAVGLSGSPTGTPIPGFGCYNLMIDTTQLQLVSRLPTDVTGWSLTRYVTLGDLTKLAPLGKSVSIWAQAAWNDSKTGQVKLTAATRCTPDFATRLNTTVPKMRGVYQYTGSRDVWGPVLVTPITKFN